MNIIWLRHLVYLWGKFDKVKPSGWFICTILSIWKPFWYRHSYNSDMLMKSMSIHWVKTDFHLTGTDRVGQEFWSDPVRSEPKTFSSFQKFLITCCNYQALISCFLQVRSNRDPEQRKVKTILSFLRNDRIGTDRISNFAISAHACIKILSDRVRSGEVEISTSFLWYNKLYTSICCKQFQSFGTHGMGGSWDQLPIS